MRSLSVVCVSVCGGAGDAQLVGVQAAYQKLLERIEASLRGIQAHGGPFGEQLRRDGVDRRVRWGL